LLNLVAAGSPTSIAVYGKTEASLALEHDSLNTAGIPLDGCAAMRVIARGVC
jgi:hypothetical protein